LKGRLKHYDVQEKTSVGLSIHLLGIGGAVRLQAAEGVEKDGCGREWCSHKGVYAARRRWFGDGPPPSPKRIRGASTSSLVPCLAVPLILRKSIASARSPDIARTRAQCIYITGDLPQHKRRRRLHGIPSQVLRYLNTTSPRSRASMAEQSINIPQVIVFLLVTFLAVRWYFSKPSASSTRAAPGSRVAPINPLHVTRVAQMFPQLSRRDIAWDLQRNGGNVEATTERVLSGRGLDTVITFHSVCETTTTNTQQAPPSFEFSSPGPAPSPARPAPAGTAKPSQPDLITRYNLASKLGQASEPAAEEQPKAKAWSADRNERQMNLQRRREEMILAARRKLEQQEKGKSPAT
jgi:coupling of ubiquitin conjugation to ER degradation protein 1